MFRSEGIKAIHTPIRAPQANAIAERFMRTARSGCLDWLMVLNRRDLEHVLRVHVGHYVSATTDGSQVLDGVAGPLRELGGCA